MTSKDKTRQKLVGSMRKTKAAAGIGTDAAETEPAAASPVTPEPAASDTASAASLRSGKSELPKPDPYQSGSRVWPD
jgi:hypothetical protein